MREIKFRFWHIEDEQLSVPYTLEDLEYVDIGKTIAMQYTGLKDKNGVEIYEGDIIWWGKYFKEGEKITQTVCFYTSGYCAGFNFGKSSNIGKYCEVIGNIYERK